MVGLAVAGQSLPNFERALYRGQPIIETASTAGDVVPRALADAGLPASVPVARIEITGSLSNVVRRARSSLEDGSHAAVLVSGDSAVVVAFGGPGLARQAYAELSPNSESDTSIPSLIKAVLAVYHGYFPGPPQPRPWFVRRGGRRTAQVDGVSVIQSEAARPAPVYLPVDPVRILLARGSDAMEIVGRLAELSSSVESGRKLVEVSGEGPLCAAVIGRNPDELRRELGLMEKGVPEAFSSGTDWVTPLGSSFSPQPVGPAAEIAFVYPGVYSAYPGMARDVFRVFPEAHHFLASLTEDPGASFAADLVFPRTDRPLERALLAEYDLRLRSDLPALMSAGAACAAIYTHILREVAGLRPVAGLGFSLGEISMLWAMRVWQDSDHSRARSAESNLFTTRLVGSGQAVRSYRAAAGLFDAGPMWASYGLLTSPEEVERALSSFEMVFLTMVNSPREVVIGGDPAQCAALAQQLGCDAIPLPFEHALHCPVALGELPELTRLNTNPTSALQDVRLYSADEYAPLKLETEELAQAIARMSSRRLDFPRLVNRVYDDGARIFIEAGPSAASSRLIDAILAGRPHLAVAVDLSWLVDA